ncbi:MAG: tetratricopeptide repeat protein, partial [Chloroflexia bacterium]
MAAHASGVKIVPTKGARFTTGLRRGILLTLLSALGITLIAGAGYLLAETAWLSNLLAPAAPAVAPPVQEPASQQPSSQTQVEQPAPVLPEINDSRPPAPGANNSQSENNSPAIPADIEQSALAGTDALVLRDRGVEAYKGGNYEESVALLEQSVGLNKDDAVAQFQLGMAYMSITGRDHSLDDAELAFRTTVSLQPSWAAAHQMLAESFLRRNFFKEAIPFAQEATQLDPKMAEGWLTLGRAYTGAGMDSEAQQAYAEAAKYAPTP